MPPTPIYPYFTAQTAPAEELWLFAVIALLVLFSFAAAATAIYRRTERGTAILRTIPSAPGGQEFDFNLSPRERVREQLWIEELMAAPAYGELDGGRQDSGSSEH